MAVVCAQLIAPACCHVASHPHCPCLPACCCCPLVTGLQVLAELLQSRLVGEGDIGRTLGRLGYKVAYAQDPRRELDFTGKLQACWGVGGGWGQK